MANNAANPSSSGQPDRSGKNKSRFFWKVLLMLLVFGVILFLVLNQIAGNRPRLEVVRFGEVVDQLESKALLIRDERVFTSPAPGRVELIQPEGERVSYGEEVARLEAAEDRITVYTEFSGVISFARDGYEEIMQPDNIANLSFEDYQNINPEYSPVVDGRSLEEDSFLFRIVDNDHIFMAFPLPEVEAERFSPGEQVFIRRDQTENLMPARVTAINSRADNLAEGGEKRDKSLLVIRVDRFKQQWLNQRLVEKNLIKNIYRGLVIPREAVFLTPEGRGVLLQDRQGDYRFTRIEVRGGNAEELVVEGLEIGQQIIANPEAVDYGREG